jgi:hypothetical protein
MITVTNGDETLNIPEQYLQDAEKDGYARIY